MPETVITKTSPIQPLAICQNGSSGFVVIWNELGSAVLHGQRLLTSGEKTGDAFQINNDTEGTNTMPAAVLTGGFGSQLGFAVAWMADGPAGHKVLLQMFQPDGSKSSGEVQVNTRDVNTAYGPALLRVLDRNSESIKYVIVWASADRREGIRARIFGDSGTPQGPDFQVNTSDGLHFSSPVGAALDDGGFVVGWRGGANDLTARLCLRVFDENGNPATEELSPGIGSLGSDNDDLVMGSMVASPDSSNRNQFVVAYTQSRNDGTSGVPSSRSAVATIFSGQGGMVNSTNITHSGDNMIISDLAMAPFGFEQLVVTWTEKPIAAGDDHSGSNVKAMLLDSSGPDNILKPLPGNEGRLVHSSALGDQGMQCVCADMDQGVVAVAWIDDSDEGPDVNRRAVMASILQSV